MLARRCPEREELTQGGERGLQGGLGQEEGQTEGQGRGGWRMLATSEGQSCGMGGIICFGATSDCEAGSGSPAQSEGQGGAQGESTIWPPVGAVAPTQLCLFKPTTVTCGQRSWHPPTLRFKKRVCATGRGSLPRKAGFGGPSGRPWSAPAARTGDQMMPPPGGLPRPEAGPQIPLWAP